jgi:oxygen-independent coproporphyrinogen-3 oxidase
VTAGRSPAQPFGVYVHVPFCRHRCDYCAFATWTDRAHLAPAYLAACASQVSAAATDLPPVTSVFVGGGTPSLVPPEPLLAVVAVIPTTPGAEITIECNPDDVTPSLLQAYRDGGVTRVSFGAQSMAAPVLSALGRTHTPGGVERAVAAAHDVGLACNLDLIFGAAGESLSDWARTLDEAIALGPSHVSAYALTVEPGTPLAADPTRHPDDDDQADKYLLANEVLAGAGYDCYEISNWARPGHRCRHNLLYWSGGEYLGVGCAAHSHRAGRRWWNVRTPERFIAAIDAGRPPEAGGERLSPVDRRRERLQLALRTDEGVPADAFEPGAVATLDGLVEVAHGRARLTAAGRLLTNEVAVRLR